MLKNLSRLYHLGKQLFSLKQRNTVLCFINYHIHNYLILSSQMTAPKSVVAIHFSAYSQTKYGETLTVIGNCQQLGMWDPAKGLKLQTNSKEYPIWFSKKPLTSQKLSNIQYKLCILDKDGGPIRWENLNQNRIISFKTSCSIFLTEGQPEAQYDFQSSDQTSTQINSTIKATLSQIQQESDDDQPHQNRQNVKNDVNGQARKRSGSSVGRSSHSLSQQVIFQKQLIKSQSDLNF